MRAFDDKIYAAIPDARYVNGCVFGLTASGILAASLCPAPVFAETKTDNSRAGRVASASVTIIRPYKLAFTAPLKSSQIDRIYQATTRKISGACIKLLGSGIRTDASASPDAALCELILIELQ